MKHDGLKKGQKMEVTRFAEYIVLSFVASTTDRWTSSPASS